MLHSQDISALRAERDKLVKQGMHREALTIYQEKLLPLSDLQSGKDLEAAVQNISELGAWAEFDALVEKAAALHFADHVILSAVGKSYESAPHQGEMTGGKFIRGTARRPQWMRGGRGGQSSADNTVNTEYRDKIRALQLFRAALAKSTDDEDRAAAWVDIVSALGFHDHANGGGDAWKLQTLTPLETLPEWSETGPSGGTEGAPWAGDGPLLYQIPASWEAAKNDGERVRFALSEIARLSAEMRSDTIVQWADFTRSQFGAETLDSSVGEAMTRETLTDDECLARTSDGVRRFKLPAEQHFIALYRSVMKERAAAGDSLVAEYLARNQRDKAADVLREIIPLHQDEKERRENLLKQITGNWGRFEVVESTPKGRKAILPLVFRNAKAVVLTARPVDVEKLFADLSAHLKSNPKELDWEKLQINQLAQRLLKEEGKKYLGAPAGEWRTDLHPAVKHADTHADLTLPVEQPGAWWVRAKMEDGNEFFTLTWITDGVLLTRKVDGKLQWWLADSETGAPIPGADLTFLGYRSDYRNNPKQGERRVDIRVKEFTGKTDDNGAFLATPGQMEHRYQWMAVARKQGRGAVVYGFSNFYFQDERDHFTNQPRGYGITDRPLYKAGDTAHLKFFLRPVGYGALDETTWAEKTGRLVIYDGRGQESAKFENLKTDSLGALLHDFVIPKSAVLGRWRAIFTTGQGFSAWVNFRVEEYRKPEFEVKISAPEKPIALGETFSATIRADYFHGAPVKHAQVEVIVKRKTRDARPFPVWRWDWLYGSGAWWPGVEASWHPAWRTWGCIPPNPPWWSGNRWTPEEDVLHQTLPIGDDGTLKVEIATADAKKKHGDIDHEYSIEARVTDASRREETATGQVIAARKPFEVIVWADRGYTRPGETVETTISALSAAGEPVKNAKGMLKVLRLSIGKDGKLSEAETKSHEITTDAEGRATVKFEAPPAGQYRLAATLALAGGEAVEGAIILNVYGEKSDSATWTYGPLEILTDKTEYQPGETAKLRVNSDRENASVWLFLRAEGQAAAEARRISLDGKSSEIDLPLAAADQPNLFVEAVTVHGGKVHSAVRQILVPPVSKVINVSIEPSKTKVKPREESKLRVILRDENGKPLHGKFALTIYDKSLEAITGGSNVPAITPAFWNWKRSYSASLGDSVPLPERSYGDGDQMQEFVSPLIMHGGAGGGRALGYGIGAISRSEVMESDAFAAPAAAPARMMEKASVAADESAGGAAPASPTLIRKDFADLVKWAGEVDTSADGSAEIPVTWPDNLTTWKARVWTVLPGTRVGEGSAEIVTYKDLLIRLQMPRFLVERDEATFSAIVHNDHATAKNVKVSLELEGASLDAPANESKQVEIPAGGETRVDWKVIAKAEGTATVRMKVTADDDSDAVEKSLPVLVHGMLRTDSWSRTVSGDQKSAVIEAVVPDQLRPEQTKLTIRFSPSAATAVVDAIPYLASYPHGCTEQTLNRFVPTVLAAKMLRDLGINLADVKAKRNNLNPQQLGDSASRAEQWRQWQENPVFDNADLMDMTRAGIDRLGGMQNSDGGWGWFSGYGEQSYPHTTAVVIHGLITARANGAKVPGNLIDRATEWLTGYENKQIAALQLHDQREALRKEGKKIKADNRYEKSAADATDAFIRMVLGEAGRDSEPMTAYLFRDHLTLPVYARCLLGLELHRKDDSRRDEVIRQISQFLKRDAENQTAYLQLPNQNYWWFWYGSEVETHAWFLKLLAAAKPNDADARGLAKYLVNNRRYGYYWNSTRDTAYAIEALVSYIKASGENAPNMDVRILMDGNEARSLKITPENLFTFDGTITLTGDAVKHGKHTITLEKSGKGTLYANAYLEVFSLEDKLRAAGLEVKVQRKAWKLVAMQTGEQVPDSSGLVVTQQGERFRREPLADGATVKSGERIEMELILESKNDYEYLLFSDKKPAGFESIDTLSGYIAAGGISVYQEPRDQSVDFFLRTLPRGTHTIRHTLRAETPGTFKALPATAAAMYAPELRGNSEDIRLGVE